MNTFREAQDQQYAQAENHYESEREDIARDEQDQPEYQIKEDK